MFNQHSYANSTQDSGAYMEIIQQVDPEDESASPHELAPLFMPLRSTRLEGSIAGPVANLRMTHLFAHPEGETGAVLEAVYRFPLPGDAAVTGVEIRFGETVIRAELAERQQAGSRYDQARRTGHQAVLVTQETPDVFSMHVSGITSGETITVQTSFVQRLWPSSRGFEIRLPLTPAPRYVSDAARDGRQEHGQPLALASDPGHRFRLSIQVDGEAKISSPSHEIEISDSDESHSIKLSDGEIIPDRDLLLQIELPAFADRPTLTVYQEPDEQSGHDYLLALVTPPGEISHEATTPREVILLVDRSGSMSGPKWQAADWTVRRFLSGLQPDDYFSLGLFHSATRWFSRVSVPASSENVAAARAFLDAYQDSGGTELELALREAMDCGRVNGDYARHIVIITDAQVSNARDNLELVRSESARTDRRRVSMLCIDAAPNSWLVHEMTTIGGGQAEFLTSDPDEGDVATALDEMMGFWDRPIATGLKLRINRTDVWSMGRKVQDDDSTGTSEAIDLGDLPAGQPIWVVSRHRMDDNPLHIILIQSGGEVLAQASQAVKTTAGIRALFGSERLTRLEFAANPSQFWERGRHRSRSAENELKDQLVRESLSYGLICSETAFIGVREEAGQLVQRGSIVPNALAAGWNAGFMAAESGIRYASYDSGSAAGVMYNMAPPPMPADAEFSMPESGPFESQPIEHRLERRREQAREQDLLIFSGVPDRDATSVIYEADSLDSRTMVSSLLVTIDGDLNGFDGELIIYVGGRSRPRARVLLSDVLDQGGTRPMYFWVRPGEAIRVEMHPKAAGVEAPQMEIRLGISRS